MKKKPLDWGKGGKINLEEPVRVASPTRINLEEPIRVASPTRTHSLRVGWRNFFSSCDVVLCQFLVLARNRFWFYLLCNYVLRVQYSCGVVLVFWFWREIVFGVTYVLSVQHSCAVVSVFLLWQEIVL